MASIWNRSAGGLVIVGGAIKICPSCPCMCTGASSYVVTHSGALGSATVVATWTFTLIPVCITEFGQPSGPFCRFGGILSGTGTNEVKLTRTVNSPITGPPHFAIFRSGGGCAQASTKDDSVNDPVGTYGGGNWTVT